MNRNQPQYYEKPQTCPDHGRPLTIVADRRGRKTIEIAPGDTGL